VLKMMDKAGGRFFDMATVKTEMRGIVADGDTVVVLQRMSCVAHSWNPVKVPDRKSAVV